MYNVISDYNLINSKNEWHDDSAYNNSLSDTSRYDNGIDYSNLKLLNQKKIGNININFYLEETPSTYGY